jgi:hypothetical protein
MDSSEQRHDLIENLSKYLIGIDSVFAFRCRACGKCCKNREDILLQTRDLFKIGVKLNLSTEEVIKTYCDVYIGPDSRIPLLRLKPKGVNSVCPLLINDRCMVHTHKPVVCALFPIGRVIAPEDLDNPTQDSKRKLHYIINECPNASKRMKQTVRQWLEGFDIPADDKFYVQWSDLVIGFAIRMREYEEMKFAEKTLDIIRSAVYQSLYLDYDTSKEFKPQFENNTEKLMGVFKGLEKHMSGGNGVK